MATASVTTLAGGASGPAAAVWRIDSAVPEAPRLLFRRVLSLSFPLRGPAQRIVFDESAAVLQGLFDPLEFAVSDIFEASLPAAGEEDAVGEPYRPGTVEQRGEGVLVKLQAPRQVVELRLPALTYPEDAVLGLHRADGDAVSEEPTTVLRARQVLEWTGPLSFRGAPTFAAAAQLPGGQTSMESAASLFESEHRFTPAAEFIGADFVIRPRDSDVVLSAENARRLRLRSYPTGPRLGIAVPGDLASTVFFWQVPGEVGRGTPAEEGTVDAGEALARELNRYLADRFDGTCDRLDVALVIESDAPCYFTLSELELPHHLEVDLVVADSGDFVLPQSAASSRDKEKLHFPGDRLAVEARTLEVPSGVEVLEAPLKVAESFGDERLAPGATAPQPVPAGKTGVLLEPERSVGQQITPAEALAVRGLLLGVMALVDGTELLVAIEEDAGGVPSGRKLGEASLDLPEAGRRLWAAVRFDLSFLPSQPYWLLIRTATGRGVWLTEPGNGGVSMLERSGPQAPWRLLSTHRDATGSYRVLSTAEELGDTCPVNLSVDGQTIEPASRGADFTVYELAPVVDQFLSAVGSEGSLLVPLAFTAVVAGFLTVYPPVIKYRISH